MLELNFLALHKELIIHSTVVVNEFHVCSLHGVKVEAPLLLAHLSPDCRPNATKSHTHSFQDKKKTVSLNHQNHLRGHNQ